MYFFTITFFPNYNVSVICGVITVICNTFMFVTVYRIIMSNEAHKVHLLVNNISLHVSNIPIVK